MTALLDVSGLTAGYGATAVLREVSFAVRPGRTLGLVGENGAGKSTMMRIVAGMVGAELAVALDVPLLQQVRQALVAIGNLFIGCDALEDLAIFLIGGIADLDLVAQAAQEPFLGQRILFGTLSVKSRLFFGLQTCDALLCRRRGRCCARARTCSQGRRCGQAVAKADRDP